MTGISTRAARALICSTALSLACESAKSANPLSPEVAGPIPGVSISAPTPLDPPPGGQVVRSSTPPVLVAANATTTGQRALYLEIQVASDVNFQSLVHHAQRVEPGQNGQTSYRLPEQLGAGFQYYWRARASDGANVGPYSSTSPFTVVDPVVIEVPTPLEPIGSIATNKPVFRVRNGRIEGTTGVYYRFQIATAPDPSAIVAVITVPVGPGGETTMSVGDLPYSRTMYWRVFASDGTTESPFSPIVSFTTPNAPSGGGGGGTGGGGGGTGGGGTGGTGARTPDPPPGQRLPLPNMSAVVRDVAASVGNLNAASCNNWLFMDKLVDTLRSHDTRWGYNWKRGNVGDPSLDVIAYHWSAGPDEGSIDVYLIDVVIGHCSSGASAGWTDVTDATYNAGGVGRWTGRGRF